MYWASWGVCWINTEFGRCKFILSGRAKDLSALPRILFGLKNAKLVMLKPKTDMNAEACVYLDDGVKIFENKSYNTLVYFKFKWLQLKATEL
jgi:hypothetical protein